MSFETLIEILNNSKCSIICYPKYPDFECLSLGLGRLWGHTDYLACKL